MDTNRTLVCLQQLLVHPASTLVSGIAASIQKILSELLGHQHGLVYLNSQPEATHSIVRSLLENGDQSFGLYLANCVRAFSCLDSLFFLCKDKTRFEFPVSPTLGGWAVLFWPLVDSTRSQLLICP